MKRLRKAVREGRVEFSDHALDEMDADELALEPVRTVLLRGALRATHEYDPLGVQYLVRGSVDDDDSEVVCRFATPSLLRIITVYAILERPDPVSEPADPCQFCTRSTGLEERLVTVHRQRHGHPFTFERIPARVCDHCGHRYFSLAVTETLDRRMDTPQTRLKPVPVITPDNSA